MQIFRQMNLIYRLLLIIIMKTFLFNINMTRENWNQWERGQKKITTKLFKD